jgi:hypothetical protein
MINCVIRWWLARKTRTTPCCEVLPTERLAATAPADSVRKTKTTSKMAPSDLTFERRSRGSSTARVYQRSAAASLGSDDLEA